MLCEVEAKGVDEVSGFLSELLWFSFEGKADRAAREWDPASDLHELFPSSVFPSPHASQKSLQLQGPVLGLDFLPPGPLPNLSIIDSG